MNLIDSICRWPIIKKLCFKSLWWINPQATIKLASLFLSQQTCLCCLCNNWGTPIIILSFGWLSRDHLLIKTIQMLKHIYVHYEVQSSNCQWLKLNSEYLWKNWSLLFVMALQFSLISPFFFIYSLFWPLKVCRKSKAQNKVRKLSPWPRKLTLNTNRKFAQLYKVTTTLCSPTTSRGTWTLYAPTTRWNLCNYGIITFTKEVFYSGSPISYKNKAHYFIQFSRSDQWLDF